MKKKEFVETLKGVISPDALKVLAASNELTELFRIHNQTEKSLKDALSNLREFAQENTGLIEKAEELHDELCIYRNKADDVERQTIENADRLESVVCREKVLAEMDLNLSFAQSRGDELKEIITMMLAKAERVDHE